jgi:Kdo2-lipid IVA lauroyltransferase/acyltransferase
MDLCDQVFGKLLAAAAGRAAVGDGLDFIESQPFLGQRAQFGFAQAIADTNEHGSIIPKCESFAIVSLNLPPPDSPLIGPGPVSLQAETHSPMTASLKILIARALIRLLALPPLRLLHALAVPLGWLASAWPSRKQAVIRAHLELAFPELDAAARHRLQRRHWIEMARLALETGAIWHWSKRRILAHVSGVEGWEHVEAAQASGRGYLMVGAHLGNWEILSLYASLRQPMAYLYKPPKDDHIDRLLKASRERFGGELIATGSVAMRRLLRQLRRGGGIGLLADQQPKQGGGRFVPLFGRPALTMTLVHRLARQTDCAVLLCGTPRLPNGRGWTVNIQPADERMFGDDEEAALRCLNEWLESQIRAHPAQYLWSYKRFSIRPEGEADLYPPRR